MLRLTDVHVARGDLTLLSGVGFAVGRGDGLILKGPNGIGKTTLLRVIAGLGRCEAGHIDRPDCVFVGHANGVKANLTVAENLQFWAATYGTATVADALEALNLTSLKTRLAGRLSAGQQRRLGLARLIVSAAPLWILDEPAVSLDTASEGVLMGLLTRYMAQGGMVLATSHTPLDLKIPTLDLAQFKARTPVSSSFEGAFL